MASSKSQTKKPSLAETHPELAAQADGWDPATVTSGSSMRKMWKCDRGHSWESTISNRSRGSSCPFCTGRKTIVGNNDLATTHPELAAQADGWDPRSLKAYSNKKVGWSGPCGHSWLMRVANRTLGGNCPFCAGQQLLVGFNDLATTHPELAAQADGWDPTTVTSGSNIPKRWKCEFGHLWIVKANHRSSGSNCPFCAGQQLLVGFNDLATTHPELAAQADGWDPTTVGRSSEKKLPWKGQCEHVWHSTIKDRAEGTSCPFCSGQKVLEGFNDLATTDPVLASQAVGWDTTKVSSWSNKSFLWEAECGHSWKSSVGNRSRGSGCPYCSGKLVLAGFNDLATINPELAAEADGWDPTTVTPHSGKKVTWKCTQGHLWKSQISNRALGKGCPSCAHHGYDPNKSGWLYFIDHHGLEMYQIGISNSPDDRLANHKSRGWEVIEIRGPMDGHLTQKLEDECLLALRKRGAVLGRKGSLAGFDGYTEAWTKKSLNVTSIKQILDWVYEDEGVRND